MRIAARPRSAFDSISCPSTSYCAAVGFHGSAALAEAWAGSNWVSQTVPRTAAPLTTDDLFHVSCVTPAICYAVGYRHNPRVRYSFRTLGMFWNGSSWTIQKSLNV